MSQATPSLFEVWGIEIEFMVVDAASLDVRPIVDRALRAAAGGGDWVEDVDAGVIGWSNELVNHVVELKNSVPVATLEGLADEFQASIARLNGILAEHGARLMPTATHPWMLPASETQIWPHESAPIYRAYDRLFDCRRHGWSNLQSVHLNLPFADEAEFGRLLAAIRLVLPLIPALAASSPVSEGRATGRLDSRLVHYRHNSARMPSMTGDVVPEPIYGFADYRSRVLAPITRELRAAGADPFMLDREWTNARGAIARFDRMAVEIRVIDAQECPRADLAVCAAVGAVVRAMVEERWAPLADQQPWPSEPLLRLLERTIDQGPAAPLADRRFVALFGADPSRTETAGQLWRGLIERTFTGPRELESSLEVILDRGTLAERILAALGPEFGRDRLRATYGELCQCLATGRSFAP